jgi:hypothetical protein
MSLWNKIERRRKKYYTKYSRLFRLALKEQRQPVAEYLNGVNDPQELPALIPQMIKEDGLRDLYIEMYGDIGASFRKNFDAILKSRVQEYQRKDLVDDIYMEEMRAFAEKHGAENITLLSEFSRKMLIKFIQESLSEGIEKGYGIDKITTLIRRNLETTYAKSERWRAKRIAQTETLTASNYASFKSAEDTGLNFRKVWMTAPWGVSKTERHNLYPELQEQRPMMHETFKFGKNYEMMHPGDPMGGPENTINCKCAIGYEPITNN